MLEFEYTENTGFGKLDETEVDLILRDWMHDIGGFARTSFIQHVPIDQGGIIDNISESRVNKTGNFWTVSVGIDPVQTRHPGESPEYPRFVDEGTGIFGPHGALGGGDSADGFMPIHGNVMAFEKASGETVFTRFVSGQEGQHFSDIVTAETNRFIEETKAEIALRISVLLI